MNLTTEEMKGLAQQERNMENGKQPYVMNRNGKWAFPAELLDECGIVSGQSVSDAMIQTLMQRSLANLSVKIAIQKAQKS